MAERKRVERRFDKWAEMIVHMVHSAPTRAAAAKAVEGTLSMVYPEWLYQDSPDAQPQVCYQDIRPDQASTEPSNG